MSGFVGDAFFGGSFDPIHLGHIGVAGDISRSTRFSRILFVPNRANPLKHHGPFAAARHRMRMVELAIENLEFCSASSREIECETPSYTVETIDRLVSEGYLVSKPGLIIGDDLAEEIPRWHQSRHLLERVTVILVQRKTTGAPVPPSLPGDTVVVHNELINVSSTEIRRRICSGESVRNMVPEAVYDYIRRYDPYNTGN